MGTGKEYWRSLEERAQTPEFRNFIAREFPGLAEELLLSPSRRQFLKVMGASLALAGLAGCRWPRESIVAYNQRPPGRIPGKAVYYATTMDVGGVGTGLLVRSYDGRPIKIEGNELHPASLGASGAIEQSAILEMYDPDRSIGAIAAGGPERTPEEVDKRFLPFAREHFGKVRGAGGAGLCVLSEASSSATLADLRERLLRACPQAAWFEYEPVSRDNERAGTAIALGGPYRPIYRLHDLERDEPLADVILCLDADLLGRDPSALRYTREFARGRTADDAEQRMNRLYAVESNVSLTGSNADHRYAVRSLDVAQVAWEIAAALGELGVNVPVRSSGAARYAFAKGIAQDLAAHRGRSVVCAGPNQPPEVHALAHLLNNALGNIGKTISYAPAPDSARPSHLDAIRALTQRMNGGQVSTLVILGGNPAYDAPADLDFAAALAKVETSVHLSLYDNETSRLCSWHAPRAHFLECWGDAAALDGTYSVQQPLIEPLYHGLSPIELVALLAGDELTTGYDLVRRTLEARTQAGQDFEGAWRRVLHDGVASGTAAVQAPTAAAAAWSQIAPFFAPPGSAGMALVSVPASKVSAGRSANSGWLQELPEPLTKLTWDNAAIMAPATARRLGVRRSGSLVRIRGNGRELTLAAYILPGHASDSITLPLGYGRGAAAGRVAEGAGFDTYQLRTTGGWHIAGGAEVSATGGHYDLATTQDHHAMASDIGEKETQYRIPILVREGTLKQYREYLVGHGAGHGGSGAEGHVGDGAASGNGHGAGDVPHNFATHVVHDKVHPLPQIQLFAGHEFPDKPKWGMAIDLARCTGCSACVVACQSENNVAVVGKMEVQLGREMHWIRIDRYFRGEPDTAEVVHQPVTCHQCENAPCEQVCPVAATVHDEEGLNVMVYNRCIGTRYCSNNCPYKVRRFNWFYNHYGPRHPRSRVGGVSVFQTFDIKNTPSMLPQTHLTEIEKLRMNPDVTVRSRGVMEKCTFCVQRINAARIAHRNEQVSPRPNRERPERIPDDAVVPACAQACPAEAITFGDLRHSDARVSRLHAHERTYEMLSELNVRSRLKYLTRLRNPAVETAAGDARDHG